MCQGSSFGSSSSDYPITLPLNKFSHCTASTEAVIWPWQHQRNERGLYVTFDIVRRIEEGHVTESKIMKVIHDTVILVGRIRCVITK